jgi:hypothetical protein
MDYAKIGAPIFYGHNYAFCNKRMKFFLQVQGFDVWQSVLDGYTTPSTPLIDKYGNKLSKNNSKAKRTILSSTTDSIFIKVMHCDSPKNIWDKLQNIYEGDAEVKGAKLQTFRAKFEQLKMKEDEDICWFTYGLTQVLTIILPTYPSTIGPSRYHKATQRIECTAQSHPRWILWVSVGLRCLQPWDGMRFSLRGIGSTRC